MYMLVNRFSQRTIHQTFYRWCFNRSGRRPIESTYVWWVVSSLWMSIDLYFKSTWSPSLLDRLAVRDLKEKWAQLAGAQLNWCTPRELWPSTSDWSASWSLVPKCKHGISLSRKACARTASSCRSWCHKDDNTGLWCTSSTPRRTDHWSWPSAFWMFRLGFRESISNTEWLTHGTVSCHNFPSCWRKTYESWQMLSSFDRLSVSSSLEGT